MTELKEGEKGRGWMEKMRGLVKQRYETAVNKWGGENWQTRDQIRNGIFMGMVGVTLAVVLDVLVESTGYANDPGFGWPMRGVAGAVGLAGVGEMAWAGLKTFFVNQRRGLTARKS